MAVVNLQLRVNGLSGVRNADASIMRTWSSGTPMPLAS
jgi:choline dehydrogenase-like flavoprotein